MIHLTPFTIEIGILWCGAELSKKDSSLVEDIETIPAESHHDICPKCLRAMIKTLDHEEIRRDATVDTELFDYEHHATTNFLRDGNVRRGTTYCGKEHCNEFCFTSIGHVVTNLRRLGRILPCGACAVAIQKHLTTLLQSKEQSERDEKIISELHHIGRERNLQAYLRRIVPELRKTGDAAQYVRFNTVTSELFKRFPLTEEPDGISPCGCDFLGRALRHLGLLS